MNSVRPFLTQTSETPRRHGKRIGYFLRDPGNLHYFASIRPYLEHFLTLPGIDNRVLLTSGGDGFGQVPEYEQFARWFDPTLRVDDCDLLLTPTFLRPEDRPGPRNPATRVVQIFHGMSDKPFTYERDFSDHTLCLCAGRRQRDRLRRHACNREVPCALVGYPKFDHIPQQPPVFGNDRPTLIYCPTWRKEGLSSVEVFLAGKPIVHELLKHCNLIVKPHPNLLNPERPHFDARLVERLEALQRLPGLKLIRSGNVMPWLAQSDLFIGDVSATGYEWLYFGRPMVFLNPLPDELAPSDDVEAPTYLWRCGHVCNDMRHLPGLVAQALARDDHVAVREELLHYSVERPREPGALQRAVAAVLPLLEAA